MYSFPKNLKRLRRKLKISQAQLAREIGVTQGAVSAYERGDTYPPIDRVYDIARVLGVDPDDLVK